MDKRWQRIRSPAAGAVAAAALGTAAYRYGLYFDVSLYRWEIALALLAAVWAAASLLRPAGSDAARPSGIREWWAAGPFVLAGLYALSLATGPASVLGTLEQGLRWTAYGAFAHLTVRLCRNGRTAAWLQLGIQASGACVVWGALAGWMGWLRFPEIVMRSGDEQLASMGARLSGFFQYPNMLGAMAAALLVWQLSAMARSPDWRPFWLPAAAAVPSGVALLLTESRGAWAVAAAGWLAAVLLAGPRARAKLLVYSAWTAVAAGLCSRLALSAADGWRTDGMSAGIPAPLSAAFLLSLAGAAASMCLLRLLLLRLGDRLPGPAAWLSCAAAAACTLAWLMPQGLQGRLAAGRYETAGARRLFYLDAAALFREAPLFGHGGGAWRALFTSVQREPYVGSEVHSGYLDMLLNLGLAGLAVLLVMLAGMLLTVWRRDRLAAVPAAMLLAHAAVDFDMSYGYYWLFLFAYAAAASTVPAAAASPAGGGGTAAPAADPQPAAGHGRARRRLARAARRSAAILAAALLLLAAAAGWRLEQARAAREAAAAADTAAARASALRAALAANPAWTRIRLELAPLLQEPEERRKLLAAGLRYEPQSAPLLWALGRTAAELDDPAQAAAWFGLAGKRDRFNAGKRTEAVAALAQLAERAAAEGRPALAREAASAGLAMYREFALLAREVQAMDQPANGRKFHLTDEAQAAADALRDMPDAGR